MRKLFQVGNCCAFLIMVFFNYYANTGTINGKTMATVSAEYQTLFTPAGYTFSIWGLIYLSLFGFVIYQARDLFSGGGNINVVDQVAWWFIISCIANVCWIFSWLHENLLLSVIIMLILLISLVMIILRTRMELDDEPLPVIALVWWPFSFYSGWITVAFIANVAAYLASINWNRFGISEVSWAIIMIIIAGIINLVITWTRNMREFALVGAWAFAGIAVVNWYSNSAVASTAVIVAGILIISSGIHAYKNRQYAPWKKI